MGEQGGGETPRGVGGREKSDQNTLCEFFSIDKRECSIGGIRQSNKVCIYVQIY